MKHFRRLSFWLSFIFILTVGSATALAANNGPSEDEEWSFAYVLFFNNERDESRYMYSFRNPGETSVVEGASYNKASNTLTLTNCNMPDYVLSANMMGDDFKIKLVGISHIRTLTAWGDGYGGSVEITGDGKLYINEDKKSTDAVVLQPEGTKSYFKVSGKAEVHAFAPETDGSVLTAMNSSVKNCFVANGVTGVQTENAYRVNYEQIQAVVIDTTGYAYKCDVYTREGDDKKYSVRSTRMTTYNPDGTVKDDNIPVYIEYELMQLPDSDKYYMYELQTTQGEFDAETCGYTKTGDTVDGYDYKINSPASVYTVQEKEGKCIFLYDSLESEPSDYGYVKYDMIGKLGEISDKYGNKSDLYQVARSEDDVLFTSDQYYDDAYMLAKGYKPVGEIQYLDGIYNVYMRVSSCVLTAKACAHSSKVSKVTTRATMTKDGVVTTTCKDCGKKLSVSKIAKVSTVKLYASALTYTGKARTPLVIVKDSNGKALSKGSDYSITYSSGRKNVGTYTVKVTFTGRKYVGSKTMSFVINPKSTSIAGIVGGKGTFVVRWNKQTAQTTGYQIQYSRSARFASGNGAKTITSNSTIRTSVSKLRSGAKYYVRVRTYKKVISKGKTVTLYSGWSSPVSVKVK